MPHKPTWVFSYHYETLQWYDSLLTGIWGFSSNPAPAVFLQKLCFHHRRGLHAVVSECAHTERGGKVNTQQLIDPSTQVGVQFVFVTWPQLLMRISVTGCPMKSRPLVIRAPVALPRLSSSRSAQSKLYCSITFTLLELHYGLYKQIVFFSVTLSLIGFHSLTILNQLSPTCISNGTISPVTMNQLKDNDQKKSDICCFWSPEHQFSFLFCLFISF